MLYLFVYVYDVYDKLLYNLGVIKMGLFVALMVAGGAWIIYHDDRNYEGERDLYNRYKNLHWLADRLGKKIFKIFVALFIITAVLPTKQGLAMLGGVYVGEQVYNKVSQSELMDKAVKILNLELDNYLDKTIAEMEKEKTEPKK